MIEWAMCNHSNFMKIFDIIIGRPQYCIITSKINGTPKGVYFPITKLHSILALANLLAHNSIDQVCYCGKISL